MWMQKDNIHSLSSFPPAAEIKLTLYWRNNMFAVSSGDWLCVQSQVKHMLLQTLVSVLDFCRLSWGKENRVLDECSWCAVDRHGACCHRSSLCRKVWKCKTHLLRLAKHISRPSLLPYGMNAVYATNMFGFIHFTQMLEIVVQIMECNELSSLF